MLLLTTYKLIATQRVLNKLLYHIVMNELQKLYKEFSNRELITILHEKNKFIPEAIEQALAEIKTEI